MVLFRFGARASEAEAREVLDELAALPSRFPTMRRFGLGQNISKRDQTYTHAMTVEFDDQTELERYLDSAEHEHFVRTRFRPSVEDRAIVSYQTG